MLRLTRLLLPPALVLGGLLFMATDALAAPTTGLVPTSQALFGGHGHGHGRGHGRGHARGRVIVAAPVAPRVVRRPVCGHYEWRVERLWVDGEVIGRGRHGRPIVTEGYWTTRRYRVWVETPCHPRIRRGHVRRVRRAAPCDDCGPRPYVTPRISVGVGFGF